MLVKIFSPFLFNLIDASTTIDMVWKHFFEEPGSKKAATVGFNLQADPKGVSWRKNRNTKVKKKVAFACRPDHKRAFEFDIGHRQGRTISQSYMQLSIKSSAGLVVSLDNSSRTAKKNSFV